MIQTGCCLRGLFVKPQTVSGKPGVRLHVVTGWSLRIRWYLWTQEL